MATRGRSRLLEHSLALLRRAEGGRVGAEQSPEWYNSYGQGPEHEFFPDRKIPGIGISPSSGMNPNPKLPRASGGNSNNWLPLVGLGLKAGTDIYKAYRDGAFGSHGEGLDQSLANVDTTKWDQDSQDWLNNYRENGMQMPNVNDSDINWEDNPSWWDANEDGIAKGVGDTADWNSQQLEDYRQGMDMPTLDKSTGDYIKSGLNGAGGALNLYAGVERGGAGGYGQALRGAGSVANSLGYTDAGGTLGSTGQILSGINQGGVEGYGKAAAGGVNLAGQTGLIDSGTGSTASAASGALGNAVALYGAYNGIKGLGQAYSRGNVKDGAAAGASAGASIGSVVPGIGTVLGGFIGGALGILYTGASKTTNQDNIEKDAWKKYQQAYDKAGTDQISFRNSAFPLSFAYNRMTRDPALKEWTGEASADKKAGNEPSVYMYDKMKQEIMKAQEEGKLPMDDSELKNVNGRAFFEKEVAPKIWPNGKPPGDPLNAKLIGDWFDTQFESGVDADRNPQNYVRSQDYTHQNADGSQYFDEAAARAAGQKHARGGRILQRGNSMNNRGGLSMMGNMPSQPNPESLPSYYTYGQSPQPSMPQGGPPQMPMRPVMQMPMVRRAMGGSTHLGYNRNTDPNLVKGPGTGRSDDIPARLSDGEYIWDAETVALLGDGSTDEGARRLDALRKKLRMHKGKNLAKGKFSSAAKQPEDYLE